MKRLKLSVAALLIALSMNAQSNYQKQVQISVFDVREMIHTIDDILEWQSNDAAEGYTGNGSYEEKWGSNYWLRVMRDKLYDHLHTQRASHKIDTSKYVYITYEGIDCENCDEID